MNKLNVVLYSFRQGVISLIRNRIFSLASVGTVAACLFLFGIFYFVLGNFRHIIRGAESAVGISVFFEEDLPEKSIQEIGDEIQQRQEVDRVEYVSAEEAWERFKEENFQNAPELVESFRDDNPLEDSASFEVYLKSIRQQDTLVEYVEGLKGVREVKRSAEVAKSLYGMSNLVGIISSALILILLLVSVFLIHSTIAMGIAVRKPEISLMRLMGASDFFIWSPFIVEGIVIGFVGSLVPLVVLSLLYGRLITYVEHRFLTWTSMLTENVSFLSAGEVFGFLVPVSILVGVGIGLTGSFITVRRNLNI